MCRLNLALEKLLSSLSPFLWRRWGIADQATKHHQTSQVTTLEAPQPNKEKIAAEIRAVWRDSAMHCKENWKKRWIKRVAGGHLGETKI